MIRILRFLRAVLLWAAGGFALADRGTRERRLATCQGCGHRRGRRCAACGCWLPLKTALPRERCPASLWETAAIEGVRRSPAQP